MLFYAPPILIKNNKIIIYYSPRIPAKESYESDILLALNVRNPLLGRNRDTFSLVFVWSLAVCRSCPWLRTYPENSAPLMTLSGSFWLSSRE